jgi:Leucine-rich repeat (LRR) protein
MFRSPPCESLEEAAARPLAVRRLRLFKHGLAFDTFAALLPQLSKVREIELGWQSWTELPEALSRLQSLRSFCVLNTSIQCFPAFLASCPRLTGLYLRGTDITSIPPSVQAFRHLRRFDFSNNPVQEIPPELGHLPELRYLQLADLRLKTLPGSLANLRRLHTLCLAGNCFSPDEVSRIRAWFRRGRLFGIG